MKGLTRRVIMVCALLLGSQTGPAGAGQVRIEVGMIEMSAGSVRGYGVISALQRHDLVSTHRGRTPSYHAEIRGLAPRLRGGRVVVEDHQGGYLNGIIADVDDINVLGLPVRIQGRYCNSACTLFLGAREVCVSPETVFGFHGPSRPGSPTPMSGPELRAAIGHSAAHYRPGLRAWWLAHGSRSERLIHMTGRDLAKFGYRTC